MKYQQFLIIMMFITACSSSKRVTISVTDTNTQKIENPFDSINQKTQMDDKIQNIQELKEPSILEEKIKPVDANISEPFHHEIWTKLLKKHVSDAGQVNYVAFKDDKNALSNYISYLGENLPNHTWNKNETLAYWINAYNAMTIDLILRHYPLQSIKDIKKPWDQRYWKLGEKWYNLNEIEHDVLRKMNEPRIHFAIVCASYSCPKLQNQAFTSLHLDQQLTNATQEFLKDTSKNYISENRLELSKIFQWFAKDFNKNVSLIDFIRQYSKVDISENAKKSFKDYNWNLNN